MGVSRLLGKLFNSGYLSKERAEESDYDLIYTISKLRESKKKRKIEKDDLDKKDSEIDAFIEILENNTDDFSESEINFLYKEIINS